MLIVIGGGLAGTSAAIRAARRDLPVMLIEAGTYPRHKVCGEFLSPEAAGYLADLGVPVDAHQPAALTRVRITAPDGGCWESEFTGTGIGISRYALDQLLIDRARSVGVQVVTGAKVSAVSGSLAQGFRVAMRGDSIRARVVIAAHGKRSTLDRTLNRAFMFQPQPYIALKAHFRGTTAPNTVEVHAFPGGYCGISAIEGGAVNLCLLARLEVFKRSDSIPAFIAWMQSQNRYLKHFFACSEQITGWLSISQIPFDDHDKQPVEHDILMAGDAAGMIAPLAGDGMSIALKGGMLAADHAVQYLRCDIDADALKLDYAAAWRAQFARRIRLGRVLQAAMFNPPILSFGLKLINAAPALGRYFVNHTREASR